MIGDMKKFIEENRQKIKEAVDCLMDYIPKAEKRQIDRDEFLRKIKESAADLQFNLRQRGARDVSLRITMNTEMWDFLVNGSEQNRNDLLETLRKTVNPVSIELYGGFFDYESGRLHLEMCSSVCISSHIDYKYMKISQEFRFSSGEICADAVNLYTKSEVFDILSKGKDGK